MTDYLTLGEWAFVVLLSSFILVIPMVPRLADHLAGVKHQGDD